MYLVQSRSCIGSVNLIAFLKVRHLPSWLPGMGFKRKAKLWREEMRRFTNLPFNFVRRKLVSLIFLRYAYSHYSHPL